MKKAKRKRLEKTGWRVGDTREFLGLPDDEMALIETKRALINKLREVRESAKITQAALAKMISSSQSRVAKMEAGSGDVTLDLIYRALRALGVPNKDVGRVIAAA